MICTPIGSRSPVRPDRHGDDGQADERDRLREYADVRPHQHFAPVEHEGLLADLRRAAGRRGREEHVDVAEQRQRLARETSRRNFCAFTDQTPGSMAPAISRSRTSGS